jgi:type IV secretory pathway VirB2 component (pilin)
MFIKKLNSFRTGRFAHEVKVLTSLGLLAVVSPTAALAAAAGGGGNLPWETPLTTIQTSITGPVAYAISLIAIVAAGATLVWGGEISEFTRRIIFVVLVIALIAFAAQAYTSIFAGGAVI